MGRPPIFSASEICRDDPTRTDDPYVPNVVRYQLRYIPIASGRVQKSSLREDCFLIVLATAAC